MVTTMAMYFVTYAYSEKNMTLNVPQDTVEGLCIDPGIFPIGAKAMKIICFWCLCVILRFSKD